MRIPKSQQALDPPTIKRFTKRLTDPAPTRGAVREVLLELWTAPRPPNPLRLAPTPTRTVARERPVVRASPCRAQPRSSQRLSGREWCRADWAVVHRELKKPGVTRILLWQEYLAQHPGGYRYTQFTQLYKAWAAGAPEPRMRRQHRARRDDRGRLRRHDAADPDRRHDPHRRGVHRLPAVLGLPVRRGDLDASRRGLARFPRAALRPSGRRAGRSSCPTT